LTSPPKPALTAVLPSAEVVMWWVPSLCAPDRVCVSGKSGWMVLWTRIFEEPLAERRWVGVAAMLKMSVG